MKTETLGKSGFAVSEIGFGAWAIGGGWGAQSEEDSVAALHHAIDNGVNFVDTAAGYGDGRSERIISKILKERSEEIFVATKTPPSPGVWPPSPYCQWQDRYSEVYLRANIEERLKNLQTDCLDLLQLHTWTRAWNRNPKPFEVLMELKREGKIKAVGVSTPEFDQNCVIDLIRNGWVDTVQVIYNMFDQEPASELLPVAHEHGVGVIVRVAFDEGVLTGKYTAQTRFAEDDFRNEYFAGDRIVRAVERVDRLKNEIEFSGFTMPQIALKYPLMHEAVSVVIPGIRNRAQAEANCLVSEMPEVTSELMIRLREHNWRRGVWYGGK